jgi:hypothetical protein
MSGLAAALDDLMSEHRRIGSPVPRYLRPGLPSEAVRERIVSELGLDPPDPVLELFAWHDGIDHDAWRGDDAAPGFARMFGDTYFAPVADAIGMYRESVEIDEATARFAFEDDVPRIWRPSWFPAFCDGWETYAVECGPESQDRGRVYDVHWQPPIDDPPRARFRDLQHLVESASRRFRAGGYYWDSAKRFLEEREDVLKPLYELEVKEAGG